jgi:opacity protein-like surface antigen
VVSANGSPPNVPIGPQNWNRNINSTKITLAGSLMAGVGIQISQSAMLDIGYRFTSLDITSGLKDYRQSVNVGVRYNIN